MSRREQQRPRHDARPPAEVPFRDDELNVFWHAASGSGPVRQILAHAPRKDLPAKIPEPQP